MARVLSVSVMRNVAQLSGTSKADEPNMSQTIWPKPADLTNGFYYFEFTISPNIIWIKLKERGGSSPQRTHGSSSADVTLQFELGHLTSTTTNDLIEEVSMRSLLSVTLPAFLCLLTAAQEPELRTTLKGQIGPVISLAFSPDGKTLALGNHAGRSSCGTCSRARSGPLSRDTPAPCGQWRTARMARLWHREAERRSG